MPYSYIKNLKEIPEAIKLKNYYERKIVEVAKLLDLIEEKIPKDIELFFEPLHLKPDSPASYIRQEKRITYRFKTKDSLLEDKGRLIHEAAHVVQDYTFDLQTSPCWCWVEGIADYCRLKLDPDFQLGTNLSHEPRKGYKDAAHFLDWLSIKYYPTIVVDLNRQIRETGGNLKYDQVISIILNENYNILKREYIYDQYDNITCCW